MPDEGGEPVAGDGIPQTDGVVPPTSPTGEGAPIRTERNVLDPGSLSGEGGECVAGDSIPQADSLVRTPTGEGGTIRTENNASYLMRMPSEQCHFLIGSRIVEPNPNGTRNRKQGAIGGVCNLVDAAFAEAAGCAFG